MVVLLMCGVDPMEMDFRGWGCDAGPGEAQVRIPWKWFSQFQGQFLGHILIPVGLGILAARMKKSKCPFDCNCPSKEAGAVCSSESAWETWEGPSHTIGLGPGAVKLWHLDSFDRHPENHFLLFVHQAKFISTSFSPEPARQTLIGMEILLAPGARGTPQPKLELLVRRSPRSWPLVKKERANRVGRLGGHWEPATGNLGTNDGILLILYFYPIVNALWIRIIIAAPHLHPRSMGPTL